MIIVSNDFKVRVHQIILTWKADIGIKNDALCLLKQAEEAFEYTNGEDNNDNS